MTALAAAPHSAPVPAGAPVSAVGVPTLGGRTVYIETFGCQMNTADTEVVLARLGETGWSRVDRPEDAALVLYNTCSVRDHAEHKVRSRLGSMRILKQERRAAGGVVPVIGVMGCMAQREKEALLKSSPAVDLVVGTDQFVHLPQLLDQFRERGRLAATAFEDFEETLWTARREGANAFIPIMRGCNYNCTYCIVPTTRGREKSRRPEQIEAEVRQLVAEGFVQVTLLGQTVDSYGKTLGDGTTLAGLLRRLDAIDGLQRIRFITSHPKDITDDLLDAMRDLPKVSRHLHVPAQHGSDRILRLMGRRYTRDDYRRFVDRARARMPDVELQSDFIVGFPKETEEDFRATEALMEEVRFAGSYVFTYSPRPGTASTNLADDVPMEVKNQRCTALLDLQLVHQAEAYAKLTGSVQQVLVEGVSRGNQEMLHGRSRGNLNIVLPRTGADGADRQHLVGRVVPVRIERHTSLTLFGDLAG